MLTFRFTGTEGVMTEPEQLTTGMVGKTIALEFSAEWDHLAKTLIFSNGEITVSRLVDGLTAQIPPAVLKKSLKRLTVGAYGISSDGKLVIPTIRALGPVIQPGVEPVWTPEPEEKLPVWTQIQMLMGDLTALNTQARDTLVDAINEAMTLADGVKGDNGATFVPQVSRDGVVTWTNDQGLANPEPVNIMGPQGPAPTIEVGAIVGGHRITITANQKIMRFDLMNGKDGYTPVLGVDYWTQEHRNIIKSYLDEVIMGGAW